LKCPALDVSGVDYGLVLAVADDFRPTAAQEDGDRLTLFFSSGADRNRAADAISLAWPGARVARLEVDDEDWARRSQQDLPPVRVGRIVVLSPGAAADPAPGLSLVIQPSTGFGTGHHATTRLCLAGLQTLELSNRVVVDVGTGSGVLAMAARLLGAREVLGIDYDSDAVRAANENLPLNPMLDRVRFEVGDLGTLDRVRFLRPFSAADVVTANLTAWHLAHHAETLLGLLQDGGALVLSGLLVSERDLVVAAIAEWGGQRFRVDVVWEMEEDGWSGMVLRTTPR
jgi:ribosomal protein L11 methyltransferase